MPDGWSSPPPVSVVMPVRDEEAHLADAVASILDQGYDGPFEVVLAVAPSRDATEQVAAALAHDDPRVRVVANPAGGTAAGLNAAIAASSGDVLVRVDGHAVLPPGYVARAVQVLAETGAVNVGGVQRAVGTTPTQRAIAAAMTSRFGVGDARFHYGGDPGPVDTVYLGVFRRSAVDEVGGFDETLVRNQDYELNWRLREAGGVVWFDPSLEVTYRPRPSLGGLARQYLEYGRWKRHVVTAAPRSLRWRHLVAPVAVLLNGAAVAAAATGRVRALVVPAGYAGAAVVAAALADAPATTRLRLPPVFAVMHHAWGVGFLLGPRGGRPPLRRSSGGTAR